MIIKNYKIIKNYLSLVKFSHTIFAMPFAFIGFWYGISKGGTFSISLMLLVVICMITARNCAMAFNRYADREIDARNPRTALREIPSGVISHHHALMFTIINGAVFIIASFFINKIAFFLSPIALLIICGYSLMKRVSSLCHIVLGLSLSIAPVGAYIAATGGVTLFPIFIAIAVLFWVGGFDILYSLQDEEFDKENALHSIPQKFGIKKSLILSAMMHVVTIVMLLIIGVKFLPAPIYFIGATIFSLLLVYEHIVVKPNDISRVNLAFATMNGIGSIAFSFSTIASIFAIFGRPEIEFWFDRIEQIWSLF